MTRGIKIIVFTFFAALLGTPLCAQTSPVTITEPIMRYGLGILGNVAYSPDGKIIATGGGIGVVLWNAETGEQIRILSDPGDQVMSVVFAPDGKRLLTGTMNYKWEDDTVQGSAKLWDIDSGEIVRSFAAPFGYEIISVSASFSPDGQHVVMGVTDDLLTPFYNSATVWEVDTGEVVDSFSGAHTDLIGAVAFSHDGNYLVTGGDDGQAYLWDVLTGDVLGYYYVNETTEWVNHIAISNEDKRILTACKSFFGELGDNKALVFNGDTGELIQTFTENEGGLRSVALSPDGSRLMTGTLTPAKKGIAKLWNADTGASIRQFSGHDGEINSAVFSPDGKRLLTGSGRNFFLEGIQTGDNTAKLWNVETGAEIHTFTGFTDVVFSVAFSPDGTRVLTGSAVPLTSSSDENPAILWDANTGEKIRSFFGHTQPVHSVAFSPDGARILTGSNDHTVKLWNTETGQEILSFVGHTAEIDSVAFSPDGEKFLTGSRDNTAKLWNAETGENIGQFKGHTDSVSSVAFSPDGKSVLTGSYDHTAKLWNAQTSQETRTFTGHAWEIISVAFSPDGTQILTGSADKTAKLWSVSSGQALKTFTGHKGFVWSVDFSPDGTKILTGSFDKSVKMWEADTGQEIRSYLAHKNVVSSVAFSPDGARLLSGSLDGQTLLWDSGLVPLPDDPGPNPDPPAPSSTRTQDKLIIVAGGGPYLGNPIADQTRALAERTHVTATARGYSPETIQYLSAFDTPAANPKVDAAANTASFENAIRIWAADASRLTIIMLDHGDFDPAASQWFFLLDGMKTPREWIYASALNTLLDEAQSGDDPLPEIHLLIDCCYAGGFLEKCAGAPSADTRRLVMAATTDTRLANFGTSSGNLSFTAFFLSAALTGNTFYDSFSLARETMVALNVPATAPQLPWFDDDGDGRYTKSDGDMARARVFGNLPAPGLLPPQIIKARPNIVILAPRKLKVWCELGPGQVKSVEAVVSRSQTAYPASTPITDSSLTFLELQREAGTNRWSATLPATALDNEGTHNILYTAVRDDGLGQELSAIPWARTIRLPAPARIPHSSWILYE